jgi:undecaprenyl-diphosphatase
LVAFAKAVILGLVQGLTEFLPVSSSGHLVFAKDLLGVKDPGVLWAVSLHVATALAVVVVFRREVWELIRGLVRGGRLALRTGSLREALARDEHFSQALLILLAIVPVGLAGYFLKAHLDRLFDDALLAGAALGITGSLLWLTRARPASENGRAVGSVQALVMGLAQAVALVPGLSRSGATISSGVLSGARRGEAARFSFLISVPPILGAMLLESRDLVEAAAEGRVDPLSLTIGFVVAAATGYMALRWLMRILGRGRLYVFAYYCWAMGAVVIGWKLIGGFVSNT